MGLLVAPVEWVGGKVVLNQLSKVASTEAAKSGIKSLLKSIGAQAATNFTTEAATEALSIVSELAVMQDKSQAVQYYNDYLQKHPGSESMALVDTMMQQLARIGQAGLAGAVAGGMMGAAATVWHRAQIEQMGRAAQADAQAIVQEGLSYGEGTQAYQQATEINQQMKEGEHPGDIQLGGLVETNAATDLDRQQITSALESRDGQAVDNAGQAGYAGNKVEGEGIDRDTHTDSGGTEAPAEPTAPQTESPEVGQGAGDGAKTSLAPQIERIRDKFDSEGLTQDKIDQIISLPKSQKPKPETYLSSGYIDAHKQSFKDYGVVKIMPTEPTGTIGGKGGTFVMSGDQLNDIISSSNGDISKIEDALGFDRGYLGENPVIVEIHNYAGLRLPQGNELGAFPEYWLPGGYTIGGIKEAVIDPAQRGTYTFRHLF